MVRIWAVLFGIAFIFGGVAGYGVLPDMIKDGLLFGYFEVDAMHNLIHIATGVIAIMCATSATLSKMFFILFGLIYAAVAGIGFYYDGDMFGMMHMNNADNFLHTAVAVFALLIGFNAKTSK